MFAHRKFRILKDKNGAYLEMQSVNENEAGEKEYPSHVELDKVDTKAVIEELQKILSELE